MAENKVPRITVPVLKVLKFFMDDPNTQFSGFEICKTTRLATGTLYPVLIRLEKVGWLDSEWEKVNPSEVGRPRRRFYRITADGIAAANYYLSDFQGMVLG